MTRGAALRNEQEYHGMEKQQYDETLFCLVLLSGFLCFYRYYFGINVFLFAGSSYFDFTLSLT